MVPNRAEPLSLAPSRAASSRAEPRRIVPNPTELRRTVVSRAESRRIAQGFSESRRVASNSWLPQIASNHVAPIAGVSKRVWRRVPPQILIFGRSRRGIGFHAGDFVSLFHKLCY